MGWERASPVGEWRVIEPLRDAIARGLLVGSIGTHVADLLEAFAWASGEARRTYSARETAQCARDSRGRAKRLATPLRAYLDVIERDLAALERMADDATDFGEEVDLDQADAAIERRRAAAEAGRAFLARLDEIAVEPSLGVGNAARLEEREYFVDLARWWEEAAAAPEARGAMAGRNRIAAALWRDLGGIIPEGLAAEGDERWAARKFREHRQNGTE